MKGFRTLKRFQQGFSAIELLAVTSIVALIVVVALPSLSSGNDREREEEVKSGIHEIQVALERYAVDSGGLYPLILYGGDYTDTFAVLGAPVNPETGVTYYLPVDDPSYQAFPGDYDVLLQYGYLGEYPRNPFADRDVAQEGKILTNPAENGFGPLELGLSIQGKSRVNIWSRPFDRGLYYVRRSVGGKDGNLMWDVSEGQRHPPWPIIMIPGPMPHWTAYVNPRYSAEDQENAPQLAHSHQFWLTPGNFYYYAVFEGVGGYTTFMPGHGSQPSIPVSGLVVGYRLCGYGAITNTGDDVYNLWGDFPDRSLATVNSLSFSSLADLYAGSDGRPDGAIITVSPGTDVREGE